MTSVSSSLDLPRVVVPSGSRPRPVVSLTTAPSGFEGEGFPVRRAFAGVGLAALDPFVHMDQMGEVEYAPGEPKGTPWHPHRGMETFTWLQAGTLLHQDSHGGGGEVTAADTQYMTAGDGILHIETPPPALVESGGLFHGVQLWINLPRAKKRIAPQYQNLAGSDLTVLASADGGAIIELLAGSLAGYSGPGISHTPLAITRVSVSPGARVELPWPRDFNALAYVLSGRGSVGFDAVAWEPGQLAVFGAGDSIVFAADPVQESRSPHLDVFLVGGVPLREPVAACGPFVMNSRAEIAEAFEDFRSGRLGVVPANALTPHRSSR